jgi:hypothetical protein
MTKLRTVALCSIVALATILLTLTLTGVIGVVYRWMVRYMAPEVWSAIGTWVTALIAVVAAVFAWSQVKVARETREEQAQPNVVLYTEPNPADWQILEIVVKNFGTTPAYDIKISITPQLQATPNLISDGNIVDVPVPSRIPILAPGQAWRTIWDEATERVEHKRELDKKLGNVEISLEEYYNQIPRRRHTAKITYTDSRRVRQYQTDAELDFNLLDGATQIDIRTVHDLTKLVESLRDQIRGMTNILEGFTKEHKGVWVYPADADAERSYQTEKNNKLMAKLKQRQQVYAERQSQATSPASEPEPEPGTYGPSNTTARRRHWVEAVRELFGRF